MKPRHPQQRRLIQAAGHQCQICGVSAKGDTQARHGKKIRLRVAFCNGNHLDNHPDNIRVVCQDCDQSNPRRPEPPTDPQQKQLWHHTQ